ncbi:MAG: pilus assembly protein PilM [Candidatus Dormibacteraeota bacterium]|nr:pilus assembly protein PilM [Candidatus Dormibacteraeota bacterium]
MAAGGSPLLCLDLGLGRMTVMEVQAGSVSRWLVRALRPDDMHRGDPADPADMAARLAATLAAAGITARRARIAIADEAVVSAVVELPNMSSRHLRRAMRYTAERRLPFPPGQARWSYHVIDRSPVGVRVLLAGAWADVVKRLMDVAHGAGLTCEVIEPRWLALSRALSLGEGTVLEAASGHAHLTVVATGHAPYSAVAPLGAEPERWPAVVEKMLTRAAGSGGAGPGAAAGPMVLAGDLEFATLPLHVPVRPASQLLNGHSPLRPAGLPSGTLLANLGLAMRAD